MTLVACGLLALGVLAFMISPMLEGSGRRPWVARSAWSRRDDLQKKKDFIYSSIRELNIDYNMGKLAAEDHEALRQEYMKEASDVLDELDRTAVSDLPVEEQIEEAVREIRQRRDPGATVVDTDADETAAVVDTPVEERKTVDEMAAVENEKIAADRAAPPAQPERARSCGGCGKVNEETANFCIECGASLTRVTCEDCGTENPAAAKFCAQCGTKLNTN